MSRDTVEFRTDWADLRSILSTVVGDAGAPDVSDLGDLSSDVSEHLQDFRRAVSQGDSWSTGGADRDQVSEWLHGGFTFPNLPDDQVPTIPVDGIRSGWRFGIDGDLHPGRIYAGELDLFARRTRHKSRTGIEVEVMVSCLASVSHREIARFGAWSGQLIEALQDRGYDLAVSVGNDSRGLWSDLSRVRSMIEVSRLGERVFAQDWAFLFSPAGYRVGIFTGMIAPGICPDRLTMGADAVESKGRASGGLGRSTPIEAPVKWDPDRRVLSLAFGGGEFDPGEYQSGLDSVEIV